MFLSHSASVDNDSYKILDQYDKQKVLVNSNGYHIVSNICPHQKSLISLKDGKGIRVCPYHSWSFDITGQPLASGRTEYYCKNINPLDSCSAYNWRGLLFSNPVEFDVPINFQNLILKEKRIDIVNADYRNIMDIFLDIDHIQSVHSGVYDLIGVTNTQVKFSYYLNGLVQSVQQEMFWIAVYPYTMIEWQKGSVFITVAKPYGNQSKVFVFKYVDTDYVDTWNLNEEVWETAWRQDRNQAEIITEFSYDTLEEQKMHYRKFLRNHGIN